MDTDARIIARNVYYVRKILLELTQEQFAELLDISKDTVSNIERGKVVPCTETLTRLSIRTGKPIDFFVKEGGISCNELYLHPEFEYGC